MRLPPSASTKPSGSSTSTKGATADDKPIIIKPPSMVRQNFLRKPVPTDDKYRAPTFSERLGVAIQAQRRSLRNSNTRNPREPIGVKTKSPRNYKQSNFNGVDPSSKAADEEFYISLRQQVAQNSKSPMPDSSIDKEYSKLLDMAEDASETKVVLQQWKAKIAHLEENLKDQDGAMQEVLRQNEELETKVATLNRKGKVDQLSLGLPEAPTMHQLAEENKELEMEVERLKLKLLNQAVDDAAGQEAIEDRKKLLENKKRLEKALTIAKEENDRLLEENRSKSEGQELLDRNRIERKEAQLERSLAAAESENKALLEEVRRHNLEFEKTERLREQQGEEIRTLRTELEMNRRIVHTKRSLIRKEITEESMENMRNELEKQIRIELTEKITEEVETRLGDEKEKELREMRDEDEEKVRVVECRIPILENEIDRLRTELSDAKEDHERAVTSIKERHQNRIERIVENFSDDRKREGSDFSKRIETMSTEVEQCKKRAAKEKEEYGSKIREEVTAEMQKEVQFLAVRVTELTKDSIIVVEKMNKEKESFGESIRQQLTKERDDLLEEAAKEKEVYAESIREEITTQKDQEIAEITSELEKVTSERESLLQKIDKENDNEKQSNELRKKLEESMLQTKEGENERDSLQERLAEVETDLQLTKENYAKDVEELNTSRIELDLSKAETMKLKTQRDELILMAEEFKNDCINMSNEIDKIKGHFKFAVLVEYEEKIIELENELHRLESVIEESKAFNSEDTKKISEQSLQLERYKAKEQELESEVRRLKEEVLCSVSDLESKEVRLTELKDIVQKKEIEASKLNECAKDLRRDLSASENELAKLRHEQELSNQRIQSTQVYKDQISSLNKELSKYKSQLQHCRCEWNSYNRNSSGQEDSKQLQERIQRMNVSLRVAEQNQQKEKAIFEATKQKLEKNLLTYKNEIEALHSEVSRLKKLLDRSRNFFNREGWQTQSTPDGKTPRMKNSQQENLERSRQNELLKFQQRELLHNIEAAERATNDLKRYRSESENKIRNLEEKLRHCNEEKRKTEKELHDSKLLFREAVMSWRVETRSLKKQLDQSRYPGHLVSMYDRMIPQNYLDSDSELMSSSASSKSQDHLLKVINEKNDLQQREHAPLEGDDSHPHSFEISEIETANWSKTDHSASHHQLKLHSSIDSELRDDVEQRINHPTVDTVKDAEIESRDDGSKQQGSEGGKGFTKMLDISEHTTSIEMRFDLKKGDEDDRSEGEKREKDKADAIFNSLQEFKKEYKQHVTRNDYAGIIETKPQFVLGSNSKIPNTSSAPQPHLDASRNEEGDQRSEVDTRDDNVVEQSKNSFRSQQNRLFATDTDDSNSSKDASERTDVSDRSRVLRKRMSDLLEIKNNIKLRSSAHVTADTNNLNGRVAKQKQLLEERTTTPSKTPSKKTSKTPSKTPSGAPWGLGPNGHPKLYKFLNSKKSSDMNMHGSAALSKVPTDGSSPFDESSKRNWRENNDEVIAHDSAPAHE